MDKTITEAEKIDAAADRMLENFEKGIKAPDEEMSYEEFQALLHGKDFPEREPDNGLER